MTLRMPERDRFILINNALHGIIHTLHNAYRGRRDPLICYEALWERGGRGVYIAMREDFQVTHFRKTFYAKICIFLSPKFLVFHLPFISLKEIDEN